MSVVSASVLREVRRDTQAALEHERTTRSRVAALESRTADLEQLALPVSQLVQRSLWGRMRWLLTGR